MSAQGHKLPTSSRASGSPLVPPRMLLAAFTCTDGHSTNLVGGLVLGLTGVHVGSQTAALSPIHLYARCRLSTCVFAAASSPAHLHLSHSLRLCALPSGVRPPSPGGPERAAAAPWGSEAARPEPGRLRRARGKRSCIEQSNTMGTSMWPPLALSRGAAVAVAPEFFQCCMASGGEASRPCGTAAAEEASMACRVSLDSELLCPTSGFASPPVPPSVPHSSVGRCPTPLLGENIRARARGIGPFDGSTANDGEGGADWDPMWTPARPKTRLRWGQGVFDDKGSKIPLTLLLVHAKEKSRLGSEAPEKVETVFEGISVEAEMHVGRRELPSLPNAIINGAKVMVSVW
ncbi:hypothetical protein HU200_028888 [Digitaria exilis]|uniref:Uncharacterized protein n=1 Tax=Digitaria exilis TaxID=1010633 RepID=A0A835ESC7_9POAL|nr:hypothetical protein HU200_028888 [Digitaria exilis]